MFAPTEPFESTVEFGTPVPQNDELPANALSAVQEAKKFHLFVHDAMFEWKA